MAQEIPTDADLLKEAIEKNGKLLADKVQLNIEVERLRGELDAIGNLAYRAYEDSAMDALEEIQHRAKRAAGHG
jgi:hypothetical protein